MISDVEIKTDIYKCIKGSALEKEVTGVLKKTNRDSSSNKEDIIVSVLANEGVQLQTATVNVNIYVQDNQKGADSYEENTSREKVLADMAWNLLRSIHTDKYYAAAFGQRITAVGSNEHVINTQVEYKLLNE